MGAGILRSVAVLVLLGCTPTPGPSHGETSPTIDLETAMPSASEPPPELENELAELDISMLGALTSATPTTQGVFGPDATSHGTLVGDAAAPPATKKPRATVAIIGTAARGGTVHDVDAVVARMRNRFRRCYQAALDRDPTLSGKVEIDAEIGPHGEVRTVRVIGNQVPAGDCLKGVVASAGFAPPEGGSAGIRFSLVLKPEASPP
jgi:hypothetical protein